jgi:hypothetical protein
MHHTSTASVVDVRSISLFPTQAWTYQRDPLFCDRPPLFTLFPSCAGACSHLTALRNDNVLRRLALRVGDGARVLNLVHHVHAIDDIAKHNVLAVEMGGAALGCDDEELAAVGVGTCRVSRWPFTFLVLILTRCSGGVSPWNCLENNRLTAMDKRPGLSCFMLKFSSANFSTP